MELVEDVHGDHHIGFEEGRAWLPTNVLDEAIFNNNQPKDFLLPQQYHYQRRRDHNTSFPSSNAVSRHRQYPSSNPSLKARPQANVVCGGPGMKAFFLDHSSQKSCNGTGFFLPRSSGTNLPPSKKPACSPVLLPARVIQALNLNVYALGSTLSPRQDVNNNAKSGRQASKCDKNGRKIMDNNNMKTTESTYVPSNVTQSSTEIFLPKDWSY